MNDKITAILYKLIVEFKRSRWTTDPNWEVTLRSDGHIPLKSQVATSGYVGGKEISENIETYAEFKLNTDDQVSYYPTMHIFTQFSMDGCPNKDVQYDIDADIILTEADLNNDTKIKSIVQYFIRNANEFIQSSFDEYVASNSHNIEHDRKFGGNA